MKPGQLQMFVREVDRQSKFGLIAVENLGRWLSNPGAEDPFWYSIQNLLVATANVSKFLWSKPPARGDILRQTLHVEDDSPLRSKKFRNNFEHFDEQLEKWGISRDTHMVVDSNICATSSIHGGASMVYVRNFDPSTETLTFQGEIYELRPVIDALTSLRSATEQYLATNR